MAKQTQLKTRGIMVRQTEDFTALLDDMAEQFPHQRSSKAGVIRHSVRHRAKTWMEAGIYTPSNRRIAAEIERTD